MSVSFLEFIFYVVALYGIALLVWSVIPRVNTIIHKKDFTKYWSIYSVIYWIAVVLFWIFFKGLGVYSIYEWLEFYLLSIIPCIISVIYFIIFRFFSSQEILKESLSKNEKVGIAIASFLHFLLSPIPSLAFFYIIQRLVSFLVRWIGGLHILS